MPKKRKHRSRRGSSPRGKRLRVERCEGRLLLSGDDALGDFVGGGEQQPLMRIVPGASIAENYNAAALFGDAHVTWSIGPGGYALPSQTNLPLVTLDPGVFFADADAGLVLDATGRLRLTSIGYDSETIAFDSALANAASADNVRYTSQGVGFVQATIDATRPGSAEWVGLEEFLTPVSIERVPLSPPPSSDPSSDGSQPTIAVFSGAGERPVDRSRLDSTQSVQLISLASLFREAQPGSRESEATDAGVAATAASAEAVSRPQVAGAVVVGKSEAPSRPAPPRGGDPDGLWALDFAFAEGSAAFEVSVKTKVRAEADPSEDQAASEGAVSEGGVAATASDKKQTATVAARREDRQRVGGFAQTDAAGPAARADLGRHLGGTAAGVLLIARAWLGTRSRRRDRPHGSADAPASVDGNRNPPA